MIRFLEKKDIPAYHRLITKVWLETYPGIVNQRFLEHIAKTENQRIELYTITYNDSIKDTLLLEIDNQIIGLVHFGTTDDTLYPNTGEIFALYILSKYKGKGYGRQLVQAAVKELIKLNHTNMIIGCIEQNPSNEFYKHIGGILKSQRPYPKTGDNLVENIYYFENIKSLL